ncbi:lipid-A-disaccharide synthase [Candidatus Omnitrophota bacterium]
MGKKILIVAGEASSDLHAASLVREIRALMPSWEFFGLGGAKMEKQGVRLYANIVDLAVVGFFEVLKNFKKFKALFNQLLGEVNRLNPDLAILIDYPGFNLRLAIELKKRNIPIVYYISPQVWAWGRNRIKLIKKVVSKMIVIFKFEEELYRQAAIPVHFVGHPFLDIVRPDSGLNLPSAKTTIALLPGSREAEVNRLLPLMLESAAIIRKKIPESQFIVLRSSSVKEGLYDSIISDYKLPVYVFSDKTYAGLVSSDFAMIASGSATLESAILEKPFLVIYKVSWLSWACLRPIIKIPYIGLVNIVAGRKIIKEFIQFRATADRIANYIVKTLADPLKMSSLKNELSELKQLLGEKGASKRAAEIIADLL